MTIAIAKALAWEHVQRARWPFFIAFAITVATCIGAYIDLLITGTPRQEYAQVLMAWPTVAQVLLAVALLFAFCNTDDIKLSVPDHHARLPISATAYVLCRLTFLLATVALSALIATQICYLFIGPELSEILPYWDLVIVYTVVFAMLQALAWLLGSAGVLPAMLLVASLAMLTRIIPKSPTNFLFDFKYFEGESYTPLHMALILPVAYAVSAMAVSLHRNGKLDFIENWTSLFDFLSPSSRRDARPFASPRAAMLWFEWRRQTRQLPIITLFLAVIFYSAFAYVDIKSRLESNAAVGGVLPPETVTAVYADGALLSTSIAIGVALFIASGMFFFKNYRAQSSSMRVFLFTRPVETRDLAAARMTSILKCIGVTLVPFSLLALVVLYLDSRAVDTLLFSRFIDRYAGIEGLLLLIGSAIGLATVMWIMLWLGNLLVSGCVLAVSVIALGLLKEIHHIDYVTLERYQYMLTAVLISGIGIRVFIQAHRRHLLSPSYLKVAALLSPILVLSVLTFASWESLEGGSGLDTYALTSTVPLFVVIAFLPLATVPLTMHWTRHR